MLCFKIHNIWMICCFGPINRFGIIDTKSVQEAVPLFCNISSLKNNTKNQNNKQELIDTYLIKNSCAKIAK